MLWLVHWLNRLDLSRRNRVIIDERELEKLKQITPGCGLILTPNHADEMDPRICFEIARRARRRLIFMCNREAFDELNGLAGKALQGIGAFSVERGGKDSAAKSFAVSVARDAKDILVIFPEGEIFYLNQSVQPFHSGAFEIGIQAILDKRETQKDWTTLLLPMSIKYHYRDPLHDVMDKRIRKLESALSIGMPNEPIYARLKAVAEELIIQKELKHQVSESTDEETYDELGERIEKLREALILDVEEKHKDSYKSQARTLDRAFQLSSYLRDRMSKTGSFEHKIEYSGELEKLKEVKHLLSLKPEYVAADPSPERLAEMLIKLEREVLGIERPGQLGRREVFVRFGTPVDLSQYLEQYQKEPFILRKELAEKLRSEIQSMIDLK